MRMRSDWGARAPRWLLAAAGVVFLLTGVVFFVAPSWAADNFPWNVSPFVAMTVGGWAIGTGLIALDIARSWVPGRVYAVLLYVWLFSVSEAAIVLMFLAGLRTDHILTWPYLASLGLGVASAKAPRRRAPASV